MTFTELFKELEIEGVFSEMAWILDAPQETFDATKDDMLNSIAQQYTADMLMKEIAANDEIEISDIKVQMIETYDIFEEIFESEQYDLPKDRCDFFLEIIDTLITMVNSMPDRKMVEVVIETCHDKAVIPSYAHDTDAGADIYAVEDTEIPGNTTMIVKTGLKVAIPNGWEIQIRPRSGMSAKTPIRIANAPGTIDTGYRDEIGVICHNTSPYPYTIKEGDRIAQMIISSVPMIKFTSGKVSDIEGDRGGGFGSTDLKIHNG